MVDEFQNEFDRSHFFKLRFDEHAIIYQGRDEDDIDCSFPHFDSTDRHSDDYWRRFSSIKHSYEGPRTPYALVSEDIDPTRNILGFGDGIPTVFGFDLAARVARTGLTGISFEKTELAGDLCSVCEVRFHAANDGLVDDGKFNLMLWDGKDFNSQGVRFYVTRRAAQFLFDSGAYPFVATPLRVTGRLSRKERESRLARASRNVRMSNKSISMLSFGDKLRMRAAIPPSLASLIWHLLFRDSSL